MIYNTGETTEELKETYNPENSDLRRVQNRLLDMLLYIDSVCKKENIKWRLSGGNVLGAIRHKGFIPWDDDVDIALTRKEYKKLCEYFENNPHPQYIIQNRKTDKGCFRHCAALRDLKSKYEINTWQHNAFKYKGLQIDIFQFEDHSAPLLHSIVAKIPYWNHKYFVGRHNTCATIIYYLCEYFVFPLTRLFGSLFGDKTKCQHGYGQHFKYVYPKDIIYPYGMADFEGHVFPVPKDADEFLKIHYNDYMNLPPKDKRNQHKTTNYIIWNE